jgi:hypothetical protein
VTAKILKFRLKTRPNRWQAMSWLAVNFSLFPTEIPHEIGPELFYGWRFIQSTDGVIYFADCIHKGITEDELLGKLRNEII